MNKQPVNASAKSKQRSAPEPARPGDLQRRRRRHSRRSRLLPTYRTAPARQLPTSPLSAAVPAPVQNVDLRVSALAGNKPSWREREAAKKDADASAPVRAPSATTTTDAPTADHLEPPKRAVFVPPAKREGGGGEGGRWRDERSRRRVRFLRTVRPSERFRGARQGTR